MLVIILFGINCDCYIRCCYVLVYLLNFVVFVGFYLGLVGLVLSILRFEMKYVFGWEKIVVNVFIKKN